MFSLAVVTIHAQAMSVVLALCGATLCAVVVLARPLTKRAASMVQTVMLGAREYLQVFKAVVGAVGVDVMDNLIVPQGATEVLRHHMPMFEHVLPLDSYDGVAVNRRKPPAAPPPAIRAAASLAETGARTKLRATSLHVLGYCEKVFATLLARSGDGTLDLHRSLLSGAVPPAVSSSAGASCVHFTALPSGKSS